MKEEEEEDDDEEEEEEEEEEDEEEEEEEEEGSDSCFLRGLSHAEQIVESQLFNNVHVSQSHSCLLIARTYSN